MKKSISELLDEYKREYSRTTGKDSMGIVVYKNGWFRYPGGQIRRTMFEKMIETLKSRPTVFSRMEPVNGVMTRVEAHQHVVKSFMSPHKDVIEDRDTPWACSVASETYWSS